MDDYDRQDFLRTLDITPDPLGFFYGIPPEFRTDPRAIMHLVGLMALSSNTAGLARRVGMSRMGLRKAMASGANPSFATVAKVARGLGLAFDVIPAPHDYDSERAGT